MLSLELPSSAPRFELELKALITQFASICANLCRWRGRDRVANCCSCQLCCNTSFMLESLTILVSPASATLAVSLEALDHASQRSCRTGSELCSASSESFGSYVNSASRHDGARSASADQCSGRHSQRSMHRCWVCSIRPRCHRGARRCAEAGDGAGTAR